MALTLIPEDGTGVEDANSYMTVAQATTYFEGHLYAATWTAATAGNKAAALVMATRLIDSEMSFAGVRTFSAQALAWPRTGCPDPDGSGDAYIGEAVIPVPLMVATAETAQALLLEDRTANPLGEGLKFQTLGDMQQSYDRADRRPVLPRVALTILGRFGVATNRRSGAVRLERV